jgi:TonB family protein
LSITLSPEHPEVKKVQSEIKELEGRKELERNNIIERIRIEFESARRQEQRLEEDFRNQVKLLESVGAGLTRVGPDIAQANLVSSAPPVYPPLATAARVQGAVVLQIEISSEGKVQSGLVLAGHPLLNDAALQAVKQWTYKPFTVGGTVVPVVTTATVNFTLP